MSSKMPFYKIFMAKILSEKYYLNIYLKYTMGITQSLRNEIYRIGAGRNTNYSNE